MNINKEIIQLNLSNIKVEYLETCSSTNKILKNSTDKIDILLITNEHQYLSVFQSLRNFVKKSYPQSYPQEFLRQPCRFQELSTKSTTSIIIYRGSY